MPFSKNPYIEAQIPNMTIFGNRAHQEVIIQTRMSDFTFTFHFPALEKEMATTPVFLPGESQGQGSLVGCCLWGYTESDTTEGT